jgi:hypothetical protein
MTGRILVTSLWRNVEVYAPPQIDVPLNLQAIAGSWARQSRGCTYMLIVLQMQLPQGARSHGLDAHRAARKRHRRATGRRSALAADHAREGL